MNQELLEFDKKQERRNENNKIKNKPIVFITYITVLVFLGMFGYLIYFQVLKAKDIVGNSSNLRLDNMSKYVTRGEIRTSDGTVIAETRIDDYGEEVRYYPYGSLFCHAVGYNNYDKAGLELSQNFSLLTTNVNIIERVKNDLAGQKNPGDNVITTLNYDLQTAAKDALSDCKGAVVAIEPSTGKILCMYSNPSFDPNEIDSVWDYVHSDEGKDSTVLLNRVTQGLYAPGSTFKVITALEYMRENPSDYNNYSYTCNNTDYFTGVEISCHDGVVHGEVNLKDSLAYSCNTSFANIGSGLDISQFRNTCDSLYFNKKLPFENVSKSSFTLTSLSDRSEVPQTAIGQGNTEVTPLHNALIMATIANGGVMMKPMMVDRIENADGALVKKYNPEVCETLMTVSEAEELKNLMSGVTDYGTAAWRFNGTSIVGKTGTAEYDSEGHCNSWFSGFDTNKDIVVCCIVENSDSNGLTGVEVAGRVFDAYQE